MMKGQQEKYIIMENNDQHKRYRWYLQFDEITWQASFADECPSLVDEIGFGWNRSLLLDEKEIFL